MDHWLNENGTERYPAKWRGVIEMLDDLGFKKVAELLEIALCLVAGVTPPAFSHMDGASGSEGVEEPTIKEQIITLMKSILREICHIPIEKKPPFNND